MRTTITLDDDIARKIHRYIKKSGASAKSIYNDLLRKALSAPPSPKKSLVFTLHTYKGKNGLAPGLSWNMSTSQWLDRLDELEKKPR